MISFCHDACRSISYSKTGRHVPKLLRQDQCLAAVPPCGGTAADLFGSGLRLVRFANTPLHTSIVRCSAAILVSASVTLLQDQVANCSGPLSVLNTVYRCCPFITHIWEAQTWFKGQCMRVGFESTYTINVLRRMLTLPIRPHLPDFYIVGFPVSQCLRSICCRCFTQYDTHLEEYQSLTNVLTASYAESWDNISRQSPKTASCPIWSGWVAMA